MTDIVLREDAVERFFSDARERHAIYLRRRAGLPRPWTQDPVMANYRITNVFRELDKTTTHLREHVRGPLTEDALVLPATVLYRWFNLIATANTLFLQPSLPGLTPAGGAGEPGEANPPEPYAPATGDALRRQGLLAVKAGAPATPWQRWLATHDIRELEYPLRTQGAPWCTGAYMIRTPIGMDKLEGVLSSFRNFWKQTPQFLGNDGVYRPWGWIEVAQYCLTQREKRDPVSKKQLWDWLRNFYGMGPFMAHEIVEDMRHTHLLDKAPDIMEWANPGPGALRGTNLILRGLVQGRKDRLEKASYAEAHAVQRALLEKSRDSRYWPQWDGSPTESCYRIDSSYRDQFMDAPQGMNAADAWPSWDIHQPEMWLCEFAKIERTRAGVGRPRGNY